MNTNRTNASAVGATVLIAFQVIRVAAPDDSKTWHENAALGRSATTAIRVQLSSKPHQPSFDLSWLWSATALAGTFSPLLVAAAVYRPDRLGEMLLVIALFALLLTAGQRRGATR